MKKIELSTKDARKMYGKDKVMDELLLANFTKEELTEHKLPESWEEYCEMNAMLYDIANVRLISPKKYSSSFIFKQQAERKLYLLMKEYNNGWVADWEDNYNVKYTIKRCGKKVATDWCCSIYHFPSFPTKELCDKFLNNFRDLIEIYFEL